MQYSIKKILMFVMMGRKREKELIQVYTIAARHSQGMDQRVFKDFIASLEE